MVSKIQELNRSVNEIGNKRRRLDINFTDRGGSSRGHVDPRAGLHFVENDALVGIESSTDELVGRLKDGESMRTVIALVGMGGLGKTTLAKKIYDDVKDHFDCHAWVTVSQSNDTVERLRTMIRRFHESKKELPPDGIKEVMDAEELINKSRDYLQFKRKCDGLPLAIVAIGGLLSTKGKDVFEWKRLCEDLSKQLKSNPHLAHVQTILSFSYHDLPHYLKPCFLYVGVFPRNHHIRVQKLIRLWIAEGLVKKNQEMTLEETAKAYLTRLINRSLVQVEWSDSTGRARSCRAHDLIHDVLLSKLEDQNLIQSSEASSNDAARYIWIDKNRACDLSRRNGSLVVEIPDEVRGLCNLQYLRAYSVDYHNDYNFNTDQGVRINGSVIGSLESLEKLYYVDCQSQNGEHFGRELRRLTRLRKLGITKLKSDYGEALCGAIKQMHHLHTLRISAVNEDEILQLESMSPPSSLHRLRLHGRVMKLPGWISELENLVKISLHWSRISDDSLKILGDLPKLLELWLFEGYNGVELHFERGKFQKLKFLELRCLFELEKLVIERGSLPCLETLGIGPSPLLQEVPSNIGNLECLKNLVFHDMPEEFAKKILPSEGPDYWKVEEIPNVCFRFETQGMHCQTFKLADFRLQEYLCQTTSSST
ncbi:hypothetical protein V6N13_014970 [Hibiscus sabdariffa]